MCFFLWYSYERILSVHQGLNPHCVSLCKCSPSFNLWRVQPDVPCNDVVWGMTWAILEAVASRAADAFLWEEASGCVKTWRGRCNVLSHCSSHVGAGKCGCLDSLAQEAAAVRLHIYIFYIYIMLLNIVTTPGQARYMTPKKACSLWGWCSCCTLTMAKNT